MPTRNSHGRPRRDVAVPLLVLATLGVVRVEPFAFGVSRRSPGGPRLVQPRHQQPRLSHDAKPDWTKLPFSQSSSSTFSLSSSATRLRSATLSPDDDEDEDDSVEISDEFSLEEFLDKKAKRKRFAEKQAEDRNNPKRRKKGNIMSWMSSVYRDQSPVVRPILLDDDDKKEKPAQKFEDPNPDFSAYTNVNNSSNDVVLEGRSLESLEHMLESLDNDCGDEMSPDEQQLRASIIDRIRSLRSPDETIDIDDQPSESDALLQQLEERITVLESEKKIQDAIDSLDGKEQQVLRSIVKKSTTVDDDGSSTTSVSSTEELLDHWKEFKRREEMMRQNSGLSADDKDLAFKYNENNDESYTNNAILGEKEDETDSPEVGEDQLDEQALDAMQKLQELGTATRAQKINQQLGMLKSQLEAMKRKSSKATTTIQTDLPDDIDGVSLVDAVKIPREQVIPPVSSPEPRRSSSPSGPKAESTDKSDDSFKRSRSKSYDEEMREEGGINFDFDIEDDFDGDEDEDVADDGISLLTDDVDDVAEDKGVDQITEPVDILSVFKEETAESVVSKTEDEKPKGPPDTPFFDEKKDEEPKGPPDTEFFADDKEPEPTNPEDLTSQIGDYDEQKLQAMFRKAGAWTFDEQEKIRQGYYQVRYPGLEDEDEDDEGPDLDLDIDLSLEKFTQLKPRPKFEGAAEPEASSRDRGFGGRGGGGPLPVPDWLAEERMGGSKSKAAPKGSSDTSEDDEEEDDEIEASENLNVPKEISLPKEIVAEKPEAFPERATRAPDTVEPRIMKTEAVPDVVKPVPDDTSTIEEVTATDQIIEEFPRPIPSSAASFYASPAPSTPVDKEKEEELGSMQTENLVAKLESADEEFDDPYSGYPLDVEVLNQRFKMTPDRDELSTDGSLQLNEPYQNFGAIFRLEGILIDAEGFFAKVWERVAEEMYLRIPSQAAIRRASVSPPEDAIGTIFYWTNNHLMQRQILRKYEEVLNDVFNEWYETVGESNAVEEETTNELDDFGLSKIAWAKTADIFGYKPPEPKSLSRYFTMSPDFLIRTVFGWSSDAKTIERIAQMYQDIHRATTAPVETIIEPEQTTENEPVSEYDETSENEMLKLQNSAWTGVAEELGFDSPQIEDVLAALMMNSPPIAIVDIFGWAEPGSEAVSRITHLFTERLAELIADSYPNLDVGEEGEDLRTAEKILDSQVSAWNYTAAQHNFKPPSIEQVRQAVDMDTKQAVRRLLAFTYNFNDNQISQISTTYEDALEKAMNDEPIERTLSLPTDPSPQVMFKKSVRVCNWAATLRDVGIQCSMVSYLNRDHVDTLLKHFDLAGMFPRNKRVTSTDGYDSISQQLLGASLRLERAPSKCLLLEASPAGSQAAIDIEMKTLSVIGVFEEFELLKSDAATASVDSFEAADVRRLFITRFDNEPLEDESEYLPPPVMLARLKFWDD